MDDNTRAKLAEISAQWRSAGKIGPAVSKSVSQAYELGKAEGIKEGLRRAAEIMRGRKVLASDFYYELLLKEIGE